MTMKGTKMKIHVTRSFLMALILLVAAQSSWAQTGRVEGGIYLYSFLVFKFGTGGVNSVTVSNANGYSAQTESDQRGRFSFDDVPPGHYRIDVECSADVKDVGLCTTSGSSFVEVKKNKTTRIKISLHRLDG